MGVQQSGVSPSTTALDSLLADRAGALSPHGLPPLRPLPVEQSARPGGFARTEEWRRVTKQNACWLVEIADVTARSRQEHRESLMSASASCYRLTLCSWRSKLPPTKY